MKTLAKSTRYILVGSILVIFASVGVIFYLSQPVLYVNPYLNIRGDHPQGLDPRKTIVDILQKRNIKFRASATILFVQTYWLHDPNVHDSHEATTEANGPNALITVVDWRDHETSSYITLSDLIELDEGPWDHEMLLYSIGLSTAVDNFVREERQLRPTFLQKAASQF